MLPVNLNPNAKAFVPKSLQVTEVKEVKSELPKDSIELTDNQALILKKSILNRTVILSSKDDAHSSIKMRNRDFIKEFIEFCKKYDMSITSIFIHGSSASQTYLENEEKLNQINDFDWCFTGSFDNRYQVEEMMFKFINHILTQNEQPIIKEDGQKQKILASYLKARLHMSPNPVKGIKDTWSMYSFDNGNKTSGSPAVDIKMIAFSEREFLHNKDALAIYFDESLSEKTAVFASKGPELKTVILELKNNQLNGLNVNLCHRGYPKYYLELSRGAIDIKPDLESEHIDWASKNYDPADTKFIIELEKFIGDHNKFSDAIPVYMALNLLVGSHLRHADNKKWSEIVDQTTSLLSHYLDSTHSEFLDQFRQILISNTSDTKAILAALNIIASIVMTNPKLMTNIIVTESQHGGKPCLKVTFDKIKYALYLPFPTTQTWVDLLEGSDDALEDFKQLLKLYQDSSLPFKNQLSAVYFKNVEIHDDNDVAILRRLIRLFPIEAHDYLSAKVIEKLSKRSKSLSEEFITESTTNITLDDFGIEKDGMNQWIKRFPLLVDSVQRQDFKQFTKLLDAYITTLPAYNSTLTSKLGLQLVLIMHEINPSHDFTKQILEFLPLAFKIDDPNHAKLPLAKKAFKLLGLTLDSKFSLNDSTIEKELFKQLIIQDDKEKIISINQFLVHSTYGKKVIEEWIISLLDQKISTDKSLLLNLWSSRTVQSIGVLQKICNSTKDPMIHKTALMMLDAMMENHFTNIQEEKLALNLIKTVVKEYPDLYSFAKSMISKALKNKTLSNDRDAKDMINSLKKDQNNTAALFHQQMTKQNSKWLDEQFSTILTKNDETKTKDILDMVKVACDQLSVHKEFGKWAEIFITELIISRRKDTDAIILEILPLLIKSNYPFSFQIQEYLFKWISNGIDKLIKTTKKLKSEELNRYLNNLCTYLEAFGLTYTSLKKHELNKLMLLINNTLGRVTKELGTVEHKNLLTYPQKTLINEWFILFMKSSVEFQNINSKFNANTNNLENLLKLEKELFTSFNLWLDYIYPAFENESLYCKALTLKFKYSLKHFGFDSFLMLYNKHLSRMFITNNSAESIEFWTVIISKLFNGIQNGNDISWITRFLDVNLSKINSLDTTTLQFGNTLKFKKFISDILVKLANTNENIHISFDTIVKNHELFDKEIIEDVLVACTNHFTSNFITLLNNSPLPTTRNEFKTTGVNFYRKLLNYGNALSLTERTNPKLKEQANIDGLALLNFSVKDPIGSYLARSIILNFLCATKQFNAAREFFEDWKQLFKVFPYTYPQVIIFIKAMLVSSEEHNEIVGLTEAQNLIHYELNESDTADIIQSKEVFKLMPQFKNKLKAAKLIDLAKIRSILNNNELPLESRLSYMTQMLILIKSLDNPFYQSCLRTFNRNFLEVALVRHTELQMHVIKLRKDVMDLMTSEFKDPIRSQQILVEIKECQNQLPILSDYIETKTIKS
ncbi:MAG: hypothetical protein JHC93_04705 [Parachlamydiales bacterium]|nr:hypothetical protein [Parachlamydiales bacterium]